MMTTRAFSLFFVALAALLVSLVSAAPIPRDLVERIVFNPTITSPNASAVWHPGQNATVTWKTDNFPEGFANRTGMVQLGYKDKGSLNEHLSTILAQDFPLSDGQVTFEVPQDATKRTNAIIILFGDSGNASPEFTIA